MTFSTFFGYALSPLPSNYLFIAYGLTSLPMRLVILPFFIGRFLSYAFWAASAAMVGKRLDLDWFESTPYFVAYFLLSQLMLVPAIYVFARLDWRLLLTERRFAWLKNSDGNAN